MGVIGLTRTLAIELGAHDVRVNMICPCSVYGKPGDRRRRGLVAFLQPFMRSAEQRPERTEQELMRLFVLDHELLQQATSADYAEASRAPRATATRHSARAGPPD